MGGPQQISPRRVTTQFLRVPGDDWTAVKLGTKTEFRANGKNASYPRFLILQLPTPVLAYRVDQKGNFEHSLMVLTDSWMEMLGAINEDSLAREGFPDIAHFRRYWTTRTKARFKPMARVQVFRIRPLKDDDRGMLGGLIFDWLYGEFTGADTERSLLSQRGPVSESLR